MLILLVVVFVLTIAFTIQVQAIEFPTRTETVTCYFVNSQGQVVDTFKSDLGAYGCQLGIGYCTSDTCLTFARLRREGKV